nr:RNA polymerase alpha subunit [Ostreobium sp. TRHA14-720]
MKNFILSCIESRIEKHEALYGCFKMGPFYTNQGLTVGNTLRRVLLSNLEGLAIIFVQIQGVKHEYSIIKGVKESVLEILANLKNIQFKTDRAFYKPQIAYLNIKGPKSVYSSDIQLPAYIQNIDLSKYIATIAVDGELRIKIFICQGRRYCLQNSLKVAIQNKYKKILKLKAQNYLFLDAIFLPVQKVNFIIEENTNFGNEFIIIEIWTNGTLYPKQSLYKAINEIIRLFIPFRKLKSLNRSGFLNETNKKNLNKINSAKFYKKLYSLDLGNLNLKSSTYHYLKNANINNIADLLKASKKDLFSIKYFTEEYFNDIETNLSIFGLKISK